jgi:hypothetical protein
MQRGAAHSEEFARQQLVLQPLYNRAVRLLGQTAGLLLLANAGSDHDRQREHLGAALRDCRELQDALEGGLALRSTTAAAVANSAKRIGDLLERLDQRFARSLRDGVELSAMLGEIASVRRLLHESACPHHGLALVDFSGACCAGAH